jgi:hypothetical protein
MPRDFPVRGPLEIPRFGHEGIRSSRLIKKSQLCRESDSVSSRFAEAGIRRTDARTGELFSDVDVEKRVPAKHPLRVVRGVVNGALAALDGDFPRAHADSG